MDKRECQKSKPVYSAWYEFYPNPTVTFSNANVVPGDKIVA
ncbi:MAG: G1 family glutamic endopeptidase [Caldisphaera sp.]|nr:G1 family glutamic endopeptidase [Caldisphaera sp.]